MSTLLFQKKKKKQEKISMVTCYDYTSARLLANTTVDCLLVGDSAAMAMHGYTSTLPADIPMMVAHTAAVHRGAPQKLIVGDLPFLSYRKNLSENMEAVLALMQAGADLIKLEGAKGNLEFIAHLVASGVPVMGHLGLTPQSVNLLGGYHVQGKTQEAAAQLLKDALSLEAAGCCALVLECIPAVLAKEVTQNLQIPTIGIGAGKETDGQVLVWQDLLGLNKDFTPKFTKRFIEGAMLFENAINTFVDEVNSGSFPSDEYSY